MATDRETDMFLTQNIIGRILDVSRMPHCTISFSPSGLHVLGGDIRAADPLDASNAHRTIQIQVSDMTPKCIRVKIRYCDIVGGMASVTNCCDSQCGFVTKVEEIVTFKMIQIVNHSTHLLLQNGVVHVDMPLTRTQHH